LIYQTKDLTLQCKEGTKRLWFLHHDCSMLMFNNKH
jgi:hypothetical protein